MVCDTFYNKVNSSLLTEILKTSITVSTKCQLCNEFKWKVYGLVNEGQRMLLVRPTKTRVSVIRNECIKVRGWILS